ncbi:DUF190 domain-containing protein [Thermodesulfobacterium hveragerdense]|uniref:DUF190 domain-containing protein n=1 Tax=Thermodesulfobacterium hveragerdense TaxID=53424 RepID=UPI00048E390C|nr:DUF190 domain-containing protein [Thermodesulfobacterium hveragerdense]
MKCKEAILLRVFLGEDYKYEGKPLYLYITELCHKKGLSGVTVLRGILGYGKSSFIRKAKPFRLSSDLPIVVEIIDCEENINALLSDLKKIVKAGLITMEKVKVLFYE